MVSFRIGMTDQTDTPLSGLGRNFLYATVSAGSAVLLLGVLVLTGRILGDDAYGRFSFALALATIGEALMDFGLHQVGIRAVARDARKAADVFRNSIALKALPGVLMVAAIALLARWLRPDAETQWACFLLAISAVMRSYLLTIRGVLQGLEEFAWDAAVVLLDRVLLLAVSAAILLSGGGIVALCWGFVAARALALAGSLVIAGRRFSPLSPAFDRAMWTDLRRSAIALGTFLVVLNLYSYIDTVMLGILSTDADTGLYNAAYRVYEGLTYVPAILVRCADAAAVEGIRDGSRTAPRACASRARVERRSCGRRRGRHVDGRRVSPVAAVRGRFRAGQPIALDPRERPARRLSDLDPAGRGHVHVG